MRPKIRTSSSITPFQEKAENALDLERYDYRVDGSDVPVVFLGLYHKSDYCSFLNQRVKRYVLWSGGDIQNFKRGYLYGDGGGLRKSKLTKPFAFLWKNKVRKTEAEHFCENDQQKRELESEGIKAIVVPAFWGNVKDYPVSFKAGKGLEVYICGHPGREKEYGIDYVTDRLAFLMSDVTFHIYGVPGWRAKTSNVRSYGVIKEKKFNEEIKGYQCFLRLNEHDGFSDVLAKSILMGQYPITKIDYNTVLSFKDEWTLVKLLDWVKKQKNPRIESREYYLENFNKYPWIRE